MKSKAISRNVIVVIVVVVILAGVAAYLAQFYLAPPSSSGAGKTLTVNIYIGVNKTTSSNPQDYGRYLIVQLPANATFKAGEQVQIILHNNDTFPNPHVFAIYLNGNFVTTVQANAMSTGSVTVTLQAGTYTISCQIYCGAYHLVVGKMQNVMLFSVS
jgi:heme/copper-type cytochrome/quinol oxidase subunit 2